MRAAGAELLAEISPTIDTDGAAEIYLGLRARGGAGALRLTVSPLSTRREGGAAQSIAQGLFEVARDSERAMYGQLVAEPDAPLALPLQ